MRAVHLGLLCIYRNIKVGLLFRDQSLLLTRLDCKAAPWTRGPVTGTTCVNNSQDPNLQMYVDVFTG